MESAPDRPLDDGQVIALAGRNLRVVHTPGHTPGHACFLLDGADVLFTGDHVLQKTSPHVGSAILPLDERDHVGDYLSSLRNVRRFGITRGLGAHGAAIDDLPRRAGELIDHHEENSPRCSSPSVTSSSLCGR
ncbi:hypothetical protein TSOC111612_06805 [Tsukamurella ocularis]